MRDLGSPMGKNFVSRFLTVFSKRYELILRNIPFFSDLTGAEQRLMLMQNMPAVISVMSIFWSSAHFSNDNNMLHFVMGGRDQELLHSKYQFDKSKTKRMRWLSMEECARDYGFTDISQVACRKGDSICLQFKDSEITKHSSIYQLMLLYFVTKVEGLSGNYERMKRLNKEYLMLSWMECSKLPNFDPGEFKKLMIGIQDIRATMSLSQQTFDKLESEILQKYL